MRTPEHLEWIVEPKLSRVEQWMRKRSVRITVGVLAFLIWTFVLMTAPTWGESLDAVEVGCR